MIDQVPALAWSCRPDGTTEFLNQRWLDYTSLSHQESLDWGWKAAIHPEDLEKLTETWLRVLASGEPGDEEARLRRFDGEYRWFLFRAIGELPAETQLALLRVLQEREFERVGGSQTIFVDVRVLAATNRDLKAAVARAFRQLRLAGFPGRSPRQRSSKEGASEFHNPEWP